jgi:hypothetical protein
MLAEMGVGEHDRKFGHEPQTGDVEQGVRKGGEHESLASALGNQQFGALLSRVESGILPDGTVHPHVQAAIAQARGAGAPLDTHVRGRFSTGLGDPLSDVRVHTDAGADQLAQAVSARAFTTGSDVFFASGEYRPGSSDGDRLIAHELTHVVQQRGAPTSGPLAVSEPGDASEVEAETLARDLTSS